MYVKRSAEAYAPGHPDKLADQIAASIVEAYLACGLCHIAVNVMVKNNLVVILGDTSLHPLASISVDHLKIVKDTFTRLGYRDQHLGFALNDLILQVAINKESPEKSYRTADFEYTAMGADEQLIAIGYATSETESYLPLETVLVKAIIAELDTLRKTKAIAHLHPQAKAMVTIMYQDRKPIHIDCIALEVYHQTEISTAQLRTLLKQLVIDAVVPKDLINSHTTITINQNPPYNMGGPKYQLGQSGQCYLADTMAAGFVTAAQT